MISLGSPAAAVRGARQDLAPLPGVGPGVLNPRSFRRWRRLVIIACFTSFYMVFPHEARSPCLRPWTSKAWNHQRWAQGAILFNGTLFPLRMAMNYLQSLTLNLMPTANPWTWPRQGLTPLSSCCMRRRRPSRKSMKATCFGCSASLRTTSCPLPRLA